MDFEIFKMNIHDLDLISDNLQSDFDDFWTYNILKDELLSENSIYFCVKNNDEIVGFAGIKIILDEADIMNIVIKKSFRNLGIGSMLLKFLVNKAKELNIHHINLEVNSSNLIAIHLYEKFVFKNVGIRNKYYNNDSAILMRLDF